ncbi:MAG: G8 domain-containing protein, partial [Pseudomonadota bacterium]
MAAADATGGHGAPHLDLFPLGPDGTAPQATHRALQSGDWFDPATWGGELPGEGALVHIPEGIEITYEGASDAGLFLVRVDGTLSFSAENGTATKIVVDTILTSETSTLEVMAGRSSDGTVDVVFAEGIPASQVDIYTDHSAGDGVIGRYDWDPDQLSLG